jgi:hypothetical protein
MKTQTYKEKLAVKAEFAKQKLVVNKELEVARAYKKDNPNDEVAISTYKLVKETHRAMDEKLIALNKELKEMRKNGEHEEVSSGKKRGSSSKKLSFTDLKSLKDVLNTKHIPFKNRGIMLEVNDKKVVFSHGHFYINKEMVKPENLLKSL